ncbi:MAG: hypothetical protein IJW40_05825, partial [Clostridia bacterium]|nr:hypothetical protein [Clostridia bacterium]
LFQAFCGFLRRFFSKKRLKWGLGQRPNFPRASFQKLYKTGLPPISSFLRILKALFLEKAP